MTDIIIIGAGPAGVTAAIYARRAGLSVKILEGQMVGGQITTTPEIENFPPFDKISGYEFSSKMMENLDKYEVETIYDEALKVEKIDNKFIVKTAYENYECKAVIVANGAKRRKLNCEGEEKFTGRGVSWCAVCDGNFFKNKVTAVNGGGNSALEDAIYLSGLCTKVYLIHRRNEFRGSKRILKQINKKDNIEILTPYNVVSINGDSKVSSITIKNLETSLEKEIEVDGFFEAVGLEPHNEAIADLLELDQSGYIITDFECKTQCEGLYAAGDTRSKTLRQITTAVSDGALASTQAYEYISRLV